VPHELPAFGEVEAAGSDFDANAAAVLGLQIASGAVASQVSASVWETKTLSVRRQAPHLDALARGWRRAFESAHSALRVAGPYLSGTDLGERSHRLAEERSNVARLLESLARDLQADSSFVRWLTDPTSL
jgi:hypothetical protein